MFCLIIDGTGVADDDAYNKDMKNGFCRQLSSELSNNAVYHRGPTLPGAETYGIAAMMLSQNWPRIRSASPLFLAGHSRGGASVISIAFMLRDRNVDVEAMFLFDAVNRTQPVTAIRLVATAVGTGRSARALDFETFEAAERRAAEIGRAESEFVMSQRLDMIPENVGVCYHAMRDEQFSFEYLSRLKFATQAYGAASAMIGDGYEPAAYPGTVNFELARAEYRAKAAADNVERLQSLHNMMRNVTRWDCTYNGVPTGFSFDNCGKGPSSILRIQKFMATHGAMGGAPLKDINDPDIDRRVPSAEVVTKDEKAIDAIRKWMWENMRNHGCTA